MKLVYLQKYSRPEDISNWDTSAMRYATFIEICHHITHIWLCCICAWYAHWLTGLDQVTKNVSAITQIQKHGDGRRKKTWYLKNKTVLAEAGALGLIKKEAQEQINKIHGTKKKNKISSNKYSVFSFNFFFFSCCC